jgi:methionyl-tRNA synthetase
MITLKEFKKMELRVARIKEVKDHPNADKLYLLKIDLGNEERQLIAGLKPYYKKEELKGRQIVVVTNLTPAVVRGETSEGMLLAAQDKNIVSLLSPDKDLTPGSPIL